MLHNVRTTRRRRTLNSRRLCDDVGRLSLIVNYQLCLAFEWNERLGMKPPIWGIRLICRLAFEYFRCGGFSDSWVLMNERLEVICIKTDKTVMSQSTGDFYLITKLNWMKVLMTLTAGCWDCLHILLRMRLWVEWEFFRCKNRRWWMRRKTIVEEIIYSVVGWERATELFCCLPKISDLKLVFSSPAGVYEGGEVGGGVGGAHESRI